MHFKPNLFTAVVVFAVFGGCSGKTESNDPSQTASKTTSKSKHPGPESWEVDEATEAKITFYVAGMSKRLKLT